MDLLECKIDLMIKEEGKEKEVMSLNSLPNKN